MGQSNEIKESTKKRPAETVMESAGLFMSSKNESHPKVQYREPSLLLIICGNATMAYTTENGVKVIPVGCLKD